MAIYVDPIFEHHTRYGNLWCHCGTDTPYPDGVEELLEMADRIRVQRKWIQCGDIHHIHFDLYPSKRILAIRRGAIELPSTEEYSRRCSWPHRLRAMRLRREALALTPEGTPAKLAELDATIARTERHVNNVEDLRD